MKMEMKLHLDDQSVLEFELVDNELVHQWATELSIMDFHPTEKTTLIGYPETLDNELWQERLSRLLDNIRDYPENHPDISLDAADYQITDTQDLCNKAHHWAVATVLQQHKTQGDDYQERVQQLGYINHLCHELEFIVPHNVSWPRSCRFPYWDHSAKSGRRYPITDEWMSMISTEKADLYLAKRILGKDLREVYRDQDRIDLPEVQTVGDVVPWAFEFDPLNNWKDLFDFPEFKSYTMDSEIKPGRIPVGNLKNRLPDEKLLRVIKTRSIVGISL